MRQLFVSYARENKPDVDQLVEHLELMGYDTWVDTELRGGQDWWEEVLRRIANSDVFIAVISRAALTSTACRREFDWAETLGRPVLPVAVEPPPAALPRRFARRQIIDYSQPQQRDRAALMLQGGLGTVPAAPPLPHPLPEPPAAPLSYLTDLVDLVTGPDPLDHSQQHQIAQQLGVALRSVDPEERRGGQDILGRFAGRTDLYADVDRVINGLRQLADQPSPVDPLTGAGSPPPSTGAAYTSPGSGHESEHRSQTDAVQPTSDAPAEFANDRLSTSTAVPAQSASGASAEQESVPGVAEGEQLGEQTVPGRDHPNAQAESGAGYVSRPHATAVPVDSHDAGSDLPGAHTPRAGRSDAPTLESPVTTEDRPAAGGKPPDTDITSEVPFFQRLNRRTKIVLAAVAAFAVAAVVVAIIVINRDDPTQRLKALVGSDNCSTDVPGLDPPAEAVASMVCSDDVGGSSGGHPFYYLFSDRAALDSYYNSLGFSPQPCPGMSQSPQNWHRAENPQHTEGKVDCAVTDDGTPIVSWTVDSQLLFGSASGPKGGTIDQVYKWWANRYQV